MNYITITSPDNIEIKYRLAGAGSRTAAAVVDALLQLLMIFLLSLPFIVYLAAADQTALDVLGWGAGFLIIVASAVFFGFGVLFEMLLNGQTPGKKILGLRAIRENGMPVTLAHSLIRNIFKLTVDIFGFGFFFILFSKKCRRLGDVAASTVVISHASLYNVADVPEINISEDD